MEFTYIFIAFSLISGLYFIISGLTLQKRSREAVKWPTIKGEIIESGLKGRMPTYWKSDNGVSYRLTVEYRYLVNGNEYQGNRVSFFSQLYRADAAVKKLAVYKIGSKVMVHYDPDNPANAVLEINAASSTLFFIIGGVSMAVGVLAMLMVPAG